MRFLKWGAGLLVLVVVGLGIWLWDPLPRNPSAEVLAADAANYNVEIIRDNWGVPHIYGKRDADVAFGVAYAHAEDDFETIQEVVAAGRGMMARYRGMDAAPVDYIVSLLDVWDILDARYEADVPADVKAIAEGYAAGANLYAAEHPDKVWPGLAPFTAEDVVAGFVFKTPFFYGLDGDLMELFGDERANEIALDPAAGREAFMPAKRTMAERGSNAFAVTPERSGDGVTRLMINSHQPMTGPVAWWEAHTVSEQGINMTGGLFPGTPLVLHGFNEHLGWANTVSAQDLVDVYKLTLNPDNPNQYAMDGEWLDFDIDHAELRIKLFGPFAFKTKRPVKSTVHGPVIEAEHGTYAVAYAGRGEIRQLEQYYRLNQATSLDTFLGAMEMGALPSINYIYADKAGNVAFVHNAQYPVRPDGWDYTRDLPGNRSDLVWQGYRPFSEVPVMINPISGLVFNANNTPYTATDGPDNFRPIEFPSSYGLQTNESNRSLRIVELTDGETPIDRDRLLEIKFDTSYAQGSIADGVIKEVLAMDWSADSDLQAAADHLASWDYALDKDSRTAALGGLTVLRAMTEQYTGDPAPPADAAFREAVDWLTTHHGQIDPTWGEVNRLVRGETSLPVGGGAAVLRAIYPADIRDDGELHASAGDTWIGFVEWDADGNVSADVIHQFGQATLDQSSPHYDDQAPLFVNEGWRRALITREEVEAAAVRTYRPGKE